MRRLTTLAAALATAAAALLALGAPASAYSGSAITIKLGQTLTIAEPAVTGVDTTYQAQVDVAGNAGTAYPPPSVCQSEADGCVDIPITMAVSPKTLKADTYILTVYLYWNTGTLAYNVPLEGDVYADQLDGYVWQNPPLIDPSGNPTFTTQSNGTDPSTMSVVAPTSVHFDVVIANTAGVNSGYTLRVGLTDAAAIAFTGAGYGSSGFGGAPPSTVGFGGTTTAPSNVGGAYVPPPAGTAGAPAQTAPVPAFGPAPSLAAGPALIVVPNIAGGSFNSTLTALGEVPVTSGLAQNGVVVNSQAATNAAAVRPPRGSQELLWLLALPILALLLALILAERRRRSRRAPARLASQPA
ncbi:MAG: hypothetical protein ACYDAQ_19145 [Mycobacteriales bacterium]